MSDITKYIPCRIFVNLVDIAETYNTAVLKGNERAKVISYILRTVKKLNNNDSSITAKYISKYTKKLRDYSEVEQACERGYCIITVTYEDNECYYAYSGITNRHNLFI